MSRWSMRLAFALVALALTQCQPISENASKSAHDSKKQPPLIDRAFFINRLSDGVNSELEGKKKVSPDGKYLLGNIFGRIVMSEVKDDGLPFHQPDWQPITPDSMKAINSRWGPEGRYVIFETYSEGGSRRVQAVQPHREPKTSNAKPQVRALTPEGAEGAFVKMPRNTPGQAFVAIKEARSSGSFDLYSVNLETGKRILEAENDGAVDLWGVGSEGKVRMARRQRADGTSDLVTVDNGRLGESFYRCHWSEVCEPLKFTGDGNGLYIKSNKGDNRDLAALFRLSMKTGKTRLVHEDPENTVDLSHAVFSENNGQLLATAYERGGLQWYAHTPEMETLLAFLRSRFPEGNFRITPQSSVNRLMMVEVSRDVDAGKTYLLDAQAMELKRLENRSDLPSEDLASMKKIEFEARDGMEIPAYLTLPKGKHPNELPVVALIHGGPWTRDSWGFNAKVQFLANRGYAVFQPNFRGSKGYGERFLNAGNREWGQKMQDDITDGVRYLIEQGIADPARICIMGSSYGGYAAMAGLAFTSELYSCGISINGPSSLVSLMKYTETTKGAYRFKHRRRVGDVTTVRGRDALRAVSPYPNLDQIEAPLLLAHGTNDPLVNKCESTQMAHVLKEQGEIVEYLLANDEGHTFQLKKNQMALYARIEAFLADHLGGRYQEDMPDYAAERINELAVEPNELESADCSGSG